MDLPEDRKWKRRKEKATASGNLANQYIACKELGEFYQREERFEEALKEYKAAEKVAKSIGNKIDIGVANRMIGEVLCCMGEFDQAIGHQKKHLELSKEERNLVEEQRALATLGRTYFVKAESYVDVDSNERKSALKFSQKYYKESLKVCDKLENSIGHTQLMLMKVRLFINLGLTIESDEAIEWYKKAIDVCEKYEFWDELCRGYTVLGTAQFHQKDSAASLRAYDNALKIAMKSDNKVQQSCELLLAKSEVLVDLNDLVSAKQVLLKAYKMKSPDRAEIERRARIVVAMCDAEDKLISTSINDFKTRKELHEKMADGFVALTNYPKAIDHYLKMLQCAKNLNQRGKDLIPCYVSLSQTYKDNKQYDLAYKYFEKELLVNSDNPVEACKTLINMAVVLELQQKPMDEILSIYGRARDEAKKADNLKLEASILKAIIAVYEDRGYDLLNDEIKRELEHVRQQMADKDIDEDEEDEESEEGDTAVVGIGADICLSDLSDSEDNEEFDRPARPVRKRSARSSTLMKRNEKGETPLHVACEKGSLTLVKNLINQGHPLDVQDAAGWSPLHEACNHGHIKVAEELINAGANINDRGGPFCGGVTPLHDAAASGHLEVIELLLDHGASPLVKTNKGETVLDCLLECHKRVVKESGKELDPISLAHFESVAERLKTCLEKAGESTQKLPKPSKTQDGLSSRRREICDSRPKESLRTSIDIVDDDETAALEYQKTIRSMRRPSARQTEEHAEPKKLDAPAFLDTEEVGNDWLEDDLEDILQPPKKRSNDYIGQTYRQTSSDRNKRSKNVDCDRSTGFSLPKKRKRSISCSSADSFMSSNDLSIERGTSPLRLMSPMGAASRRSGLEGPFLIENDSPDFELSDHESSPRSPELISRSSNNVLRQKTLTQLDFPHLVSSANNVLDRSSPLTNIEHELHHTPNERSSVTVSENAEARVLNETAVMNVESELHLEPEQSAKQYIKVRFEEELIEVLVPSDLDAEKRQEMLTALWLAQEIRSIFISEDGRTPKLTLKAPGGAPLLDEGSVSSFIENGEIFGDVSLWSPVSLLEQYHEICRLKDLRVNGHFSEVLKSCQTTAILKIEDYSVNRETLFAVLTTISRHPLKCLILNMFLDQDTFELVAECLSISTELKVLNLSNTGLSVEEMSVFSELPENIWQNLRYLNLSHNPLGDESLHHLNNITKSAPNLQYLNLENCDFTQNCADIVPELFLENLEILNVSYNELQVTGLHTFLRCLDPTRLKSISFAATGSNSVLRELALFLEGKAEKLKITDLSCLSLTDADVEIFCSSVKGACNLEYLNLTNNSELTRSSFDLVEKSFKSLKTLLFSGADFDFINPELLERFSRCSFSSTSRKYPASTRGLGGFICVGTKLKEEKLEHDGTKFVNSSFSDSDEFNDLNKKEGMVNNKSEIGRLVLDESKKEIEGDAADILNDSFSFDLNDSFENQFLINDSKKDGVTQENRDSTPHLPTDEGSRSMDGSLNNCVENLATNWDDNNFKNNLDNNASSQALFEDSD